MHQYRTATEEPTPDEVVDAWAPSLPARWLEAIDDARAQEAVAGESRILRLPLVAASLLPVALVLLLVANSWDRPWAMVEGVIALALLVPSVVLLGATIDAMRAPTIFVTGLGIVIRRGARVRIMPRTSIVHVAFTESAPITVYRSASTGELALVRPRTPRNDFEPTTLGGGGTGVRIHLRSGRCETVLATDPGKAFYPALSVLRERLGEAVPRVARTGRPRLWAAAACAVVPISCGPLVAALQHRIAFPLAVEAMLCVGDVKPGCIERTTPRREDRDRDTQFRFFIESWTPLRRDDPGLKKVRARWLAVLDERVREHWERLAKDPHCASNDALGDRNRLDAAMRELDRLAGTSTFAAVPTDTEERLCSYVRTHAPP